MAKLIGKGWQKSEDLVAGKKGMAKLIEMGWQKSSYLVRKEGLESA